MRGRVADYLVLTAASAALTLPNLGAAALWDVDEGVNAEAAREMAEAGTWVIPTFNFELRTAKPVMLYWLQRAGYAAFGVSEWSARLPSAVAGWLTVLLTYELARRMFGRPTGLLAGVVLASAVEFCVLTHAATPDATLLFFTVLTYCLFWVGHERPAQAGMPVPPRVDSGGTGIPACAGRSWWLPCAAGCGLAALTKGPVGVALPGLVFVLYFAWNRELGRLLDRRLGWAVVVFLLVAGPWYGLVTAETRGAWAKAFFLNENVNRALTPMEDHRGPVFYHAAALLVLFAPWSVFLGGVAWYGVKWARGKTPPPNPLPAAGRGDRIDPDPSPRPSPPGGEGEEAPSRGFGSPLPLWGRGLGGGVSSGPGVGSSDPRPYRFLVCWVAAYLVVFSLVSTKLPNYVLPVYPALAVLTARFLVRWRDGDVAVPRWLMPAAVVGVAVVGLAVGAGLLVGGGAVPVLPAKARVFPGLETWAWVGLVPLAGAGVLAWHLRRGDRPAFVTATAACSVAFVGLVAAFPALAVDRYKAPRELVRRSGIDDPGRDLRVGSHDWFQPSVVFYARREVEKLPTPEAAAEFLAVPTPGYLFVPEPAWTGWVAAKVTVPYRVAARRYDFYRNCDILVVTNDVNETARR
ncbi:MAG: glycosyltransferase family 39 protein [Gemmataceae bacterium]|nr:glycosyltransferase family 39 protein [Gemmataceae bacterium]